jgi:hypothetical protein
METFKMLVHFLYALSAAPGSESWRALLVRAEMNKLASRCHPGFSWLISANTSSLVTQNPVNVEGFEEVTTICRPMAMVNIL